MTKRTNRKNTLKNTKQTVKIVERGAEREKVIWRFDMIDRDGKFAFDLDRRDFRHKEVMGKMLEYSTMTWADVKKQTHDNGKSKHHLLSVDKLSKEAQGRIKIRRLEEDVDAIFSFALQNRLRIVG